MKNYIIYLSDYAVSRAMAEHALQTALAHNWDMELFPGVNGSTVSADSLASEWGLQINTTNSKCRRQLEDRAGVRGCFLSHWQLWHKCVAANETIGIFEHDIEFLKSPPASIHFTDVLKLIEGFDERRPMPAGVWYEGTRGYLITPAGALKLINWAKANGCLPSDTAIGKDVVDITLNFDNYAKLSNPATTKDEKRSSSFTWNLEGIQ